MSDRTTIEEEGSIGHTGDSTYFTDINTNYYHNKVYAKEHHNDIFVCEKCLLMLALHESELYENDLDNLELTDLYKFVKVHAQHEHTNDHYKEYEFLNLLQNIRKNKDEGITHLGEGENRGIYIYIYVCVCNSWLISYYILVCGYNE
eukprot:GHVR01050983.1.p1 GENE.GHVR01050983.1~~GHVR01050983.1.p1  ORF type:complete len:147 (+),score=21.45 GHVR01050983.1:72-512(+)